MKRLVLVILIAAALTSIADAKYSGGTGTSGDPYQIATADDLLALGADTNDYGANFVLTADINLAAYPFSTALIAPDSNSSDVSFNGTEFTGIFDGAGRTIANMTIDCNGVDHIGLFGDTVVGSEIKNLRLENFNINAGDNSICIGGLAGETAGKISNCFSDSNIIGNNNSSYIGGLVGVEVNDGNIIDSNSVGTITGGNDSNYIGGLVGGIFYNGDISRCFSASNITGGNNGSYIGGLVGENYLGYIINCYSAGTVTSDINYFSVGGLVGSNYFGSIGNCYSTGKVSVEVNKPDLGGLVGSNLGGSYAVISSSYFLNTAGPDNNNGVPLTDIQMKQQTSFAGWDFNSVWQIAEGVDYPKLAWQSTCTPPSAPTGASATDGAYNNHIRVTWNSASGATGYEVWRNTSNDSGTAVKSGDYTSPYDDSNVISGTTYYYWIKATNNCGTSDFSSSDSGYASCVAPSAPAGASATDGAYNNHIRVTWNSASGATGYEVWRNTSNDSGTAVKSGDYTSPYDDSNVISGTTYYYWVKATNNCGTSDFSSSDSGYASCVAPSAPAGASATDGAYNNHIRVTWNSASGATGYEVWRNTSNDSGTAVKSGDYTSPYDDSNVISGTTYYYWVKATNNCGTSDFSSSDPGYASKTVSIIKCTVTTSSKVDSDKISFSGTMNATAVDFNDANNSSDANFVEIRISSDYMDPCVFTFPVTSKTLKKGKFKSTISSKPLKASFAFDTNKTKFSFSASHVNLKGLSCLVGIEIRVGSYAGAAEVNEAIVNGPKKPIPIKFLMGVKNSLRVDRAKFTRNRISRGGGHITQVAVRGGFSVEDLNDANMAVNQFDVTVGLQTFTVPLHSFKAGKNKFTCSKVNTSNGFAYASFDFNKSTFTLTIKNTNFAADAGTADFLIDFASFSGSDEVTLPVILP